MYETFQALHPVLQALLATLFTWGVTALGAASVFLTKQVNRKVLDGMLGFAGGVMFAASYWSLLAPAIEMSEGLSVPSWFPPAAGFMLGALAIRGADMLLPHLHLNFARVEAEGIRTAWPKSSLMVLAITLHNIPEGLAIGVAFGAVAAELPAASMTGAIALALGIGLQNFPEGIAVAAPLRREGFSTRRSFFYGQSSAAVEPIAAVIGAATVLAAQAILPYALAFAAGAMIFVVIEEVIPEAIRSGNSDLVTMAFIIGFVVMMTLDVGLG